MKDEVTPPQRRYDYDTLIEESTGLYREWWMLWKRIHPEWALLPEKPKKLANTIPPPPKATYKKVTCKRCDHTWTPRSNASPVQCPQCKSPYWNKERKRP